MSVFNFGFTKNELAYARRYDLLSKRRDPDEENDKDTIHLATKRGDLAAVKRFIEQDPSRATRVDFYGNVPVYYACLCGHLPILEYLISLGAVEKMKASEIHRSYLCGLTEPIRHVLRPFLQQYGNGFEKGLWSSAMPNGIDPLTALMYAAKAGSLAQVKEIVKSDKTLVNKVDEQGFTALDYSVFCGHTKVANFLTRECHAVHSIASSLVRGDFFNNPDTAISFCDVRFITTTEYGTNDAIYAHKLVLFCRCPLFFEAHCRQHFTPANADTATDTNNNNNNAESHNCDCSSSGCNEMLTVHIDTIPHRILLEFIRFLYTDFLSLPGESTPAIHKANKSTTASNTSVANQTTDHHHNNNTNSSSVSGAVDDELLFIVSILSVAEHYGMYDYIRAKYSNRIKIFADIMQANRTRQQEQQQRSGLSGGNNNATSNNNSSSSSIAPLSQVFQSFVDSNILSDVRLIVGVEQRVIHCHRFLLASRCEYFKILFTSGMAETYEYSSGVVVEDVEPGAFLVVLQYIYTDMNKDQLEAMLLGASQSVVFELIGAANRFLLPKLKDAAEQIICKMIGNSENSSSSNNNNSICSSSSSIGLDQIIDAYVYADAHRAQDLKRMCYKLLIKHFKQIEIQHPDTLKLLDPKMVQGIRSQFEKIEQRQQRDEKRKQEQERRAAKMQAWRQEYEANRHLYSESYCVRPTSPTLTAKQKKQREADERKAAAILAAQGQSKEREPSGYSLQKQKNKQTNKQAGRQTVSAAKTNKKNKFRACIASGVLRKATS